MFIYQSTAREDQPVLYIPAPEKQSLTSLPAATFTNTTTNRITQVSVNYNCICLICRTNDYYYL